MHSSSATRTAIPVMVVTAEATGPTNTTIMIQIALWMTVVESMSGIAGSTMTMANTKAGIKSIIKMIRAKMKMMTRGSIESLLGVPNLGA